MTVLSLIISKSRCSDFHEKGDTQFTFAAWSQVKRIPYNPSWRRVGVCWTVNLNWSWSCWHSSFGHWLKSDGHSLRAELDDWTKCPSNTGSASPVHQSIATDKHRIWIFRTNRTQQTINTSLILKVSNYIIQYCNLTVKVDYWIMCGAVLSDVKTAESRILELEYWIL